MGGGENYNPDFDDTGIVLDCDRQYFIEKAESDVNREIFTQSNLIEKKKGS